MLNRIVIINSELYSKANILIGDANSIQLEADSNVGKSSLINTLNFLYIIDQKNMSFEGGRKLKESIKHYFKTINNSFVVFEINKSGYTYCILVKANANFELEYYKFNSSYNEDYFFEKKESGFSPFSFEKIIQNLLLKTQSQPIQLKQEELYDVVYSKKAENNPVVLTTDKISRVGKSYSNSFTKIYPLLLKSGEIDENKFKDALLIASNTNDEILQVFANNTNKKIEKLRETEAEVKNLRKIKSEFEILKRLNRDFNSLRKLCTELKNTFIQQFNKEIKSIEQELDKSSDFQLRISALEFKINETLKKEFTKLKQDETMFSTLAGTEQNTITDIDRELKIIDEYPKGSLAYSGLLNEIEHFKIANAQILSELQKIKKEKITALQLQNEISNLEIQIAQLQKKENGFTNIIGQTISDNIEVRKKINSILNPKILELDANKFLNKKVTETSDIFKIFDGEINLQDVNFESIETIEDVQVKIIELNKILLNKQNTLEFVLNTNKKENEQKEIEKKLAFKQTLFDKIENREALIEKKTQIQEKINEYKKEEFEARTKSFEKDEEIRKTQLLLDIEKKRLDNYKSRQFELKSNYNRVKDYNIPTSEILLSKNIDEAFEELQKQYGVLNNKESERFRLFVTLNRDVKIDTSDIDRFIVIIEEKIDNIQDLDSVYKDLLQLVYTEFTKPTSDFLDKYNHFKRFITEYNKELQDFPVSNITKLSIVASDVAKEIQALTKISLLDQNIDLFSNTTTTSESIKALEEKIKEGREIKFGELFEPKISIEIDGIKKETIDLKKQVQSRATDRVLKLFLFLSIIRRLVKSKPDNKVALYIDELGEIGVHNVRQIINYCHKFNFLPIFAAPRQIEGIEKYFVIKKSSKNQPLKVDDANVKSIRYKNAESTIL